MFAGLHSGKGKCRTRAAEPSGGETDSPAAGRRAPARRGLPSLLAHGPPVRRVPRRAVLLGPRAVDGKAEIARQSPRPGQSRRRTRSDSLLPVSPAPPPARDGHTVLAVFPRPIVAHLLLEAAFSSVSPPPSYGGAARHVLTTLWSTVGTRGTWRRRGTPCTRGTSGFFSPLARRSRWRPAPAWCFQGKRGPPWHVRPGTSPASRRKDATHLGAAMSPN